MGLAVSNDVVYAKAEVTYNTDPTPSTSDAVLVRNVSMRNEGLRMNDRAALRAGLGKLQSVYGGLLKRLTFECEVKGSGAAGTAPEIGALLTACGLSETIVASTSVTYKPADTSHGSSTLYWFEGGRKKHILTGCRGTMSLRAEAGGLLIAAFEFVGHYTEPTDVSLPSPSYDSVVPKAMVGMPISINGVTALVASGWEWSLNNELVMPGSLAASDGYGEVQISSRDIKGQTTIEALLDATLDVDALLSAGTKFAWASGALGATGGNILNLTTPSSSTYVTAAEPGDANGIRQRTVEMAIDDAVASNFSLAFT